MAPGISPLAAFPLASVRAVVLYGAVNVADLAPLRANLETWGVPVTEHGSIDAIFGSGPMISFYSPAGFRIEQSFDSLDALDGTRVNRAEDVLIIANVKRIEQPVAVQHDADLVLLSTAKM